MKNRADFVVPAHFLMVMAYQSAIETTAANQRAAKLIGVVNVGLAGIDNPPVETLGDFEQFRGYGFLITAWDNLQLRICRTHIFLPFISLFAHATTGVRDENIEAGALAAVESSRRNGSHEP
jgi:hypothetical protein